MRSLGSDALSRRPRRRWGRHHRHADADIPIFVGGRCGCWERMRGGLLMRSVTYSMGVSLDGYIVGPEGDIAIGGATLAAEAAALDLIDEYRAMVYPVLVGGGIPFFPQRERRVDLELVETRTFSSRVVYLRYRVAR